MFDILDSDIVSFELWSALELKEALMLGFFLHFFAVVTGGDGVSDLT